MIITIANTKGGVGKSTTTLNLAVMRALAGKRVLVADTDRQGILSMALAQREAGPILPFARLPEGDQLRQQVKLATPDYDDVFIDVGASDTRTLRVALALADFILVPVVPRTFDVWGTDGFGDLLGDVQAAAPDVVIRGFVNRAEKRGGDNAAACGALEGLQMLPAMVSDYKTVSNLAGQGLAAVEGKLAAAADQYKALYSAIFP